MAAGGGYLLDHDSDFDEECSDEAGFFESESEQSYGSFFIQNTTELLSSPDHFTIDNVRSLINCLPNPLPTYKGGQALDRAALAELDVQTVAAPYEAYFDLFTPSEIRLYQLATKHHWTESELMEVINLIRDPRFLSIQIGPDIQTRV